jgi:hypothetical protein
MATNSLSMVKVPLAQPEQRCEPVFLE